MADRIGKFVLDKDWEMGPAVDVLEMLREEYDVTVSNKGYLRRRVVYEVREASDL